MLTILKHTMIALLLGVGMLPLNASAGPEIHTITLSADSIEKYTRLELMVTLSATYSNPYNFGQVNLQGFFTSPSGQLYTRDGFYMQDFEMTQPDVLAPTGPPGWRIRFSPNETGIWTFYVKISDATGSETSQNLQFTCTPSGRKGFVSRNGSRLVHDNGETFLGLGTNLAWQDWSTGFTDYEDWVSELKANGGNFTKLTLAPWGFEFEWKETGAGYYGQRQNRAWTLDWVMEMLMENEIYCQLNPMIHSELRPGSGNWDDNPYFNQNGGPCHEPQNFFVNPEAIEIFQQKLRYINARWGYSPQVIAWEVLSEADNTGLYSSFYNQTLSWSNTMTAYINDIDIYGRPCSNGYAIPQHDPAYWSNQETGFTQLHIYDFIPDLEMKIYNFSKDYIDTWDKPFIAGEFALGHDPTAIIQQDPDGITFHNTVWSSMFSGAFGSAMSWWWDNYLYPNGHIGHLSAISQFINEIDYDVSQLEPEVLLSTSIQTDMIEIDPDYNNDDEKAPENYFHFEPSGLLYPTELYLGEYLYGSFYNARRNPPTFKVHYIQDGHFKVKVGDLAAFSKLRIRLNGNTIFNQNASPNTLYSVFIPAGEHEIKVDNSASGILKINEYEFHEYAPTLRTFVLQNDEYAAGWIQNRRYNWQYINDNGLPDPVEDGKIYLDFDRKGTWEIRWYSQDAYLDSVQNVVFAGEEMVLDAPEILWDGAFEAKFLGPAEVDFSASPVSGDLPLTVQFTDESMGFDATIESWSWDFGDGQVSNQQNPEHTYQSEGNYTIKLDVVADGYTISRTKENYIEITQPLVADFTADTTLVGPATPVQFTDLSLGDPTSWLWAFGDNNLSFAMNPEHVYQQPGSYTVSLYIQNQSGSDIINKPGFIKVVFPVEADFLVSGNISTIGGEIQFTDISSGNPENWFWEFGDGTTSTVQNPAKAYNQPGIYPVSLVAGNALFQDSVIKENLITVLEPLSADFTAGPLTAWQGQEIQFEDFSGGNPDAWLWDFGDGNQATQANPTHAYNESGFYDVSLTIWDTLQTDSIVKSDFIHVKDTLDAEFTADTTVITIDQRVYFTDLSKGEPESWRWLFGDGFKSEFQNPSHKFESTGNFTVSLKVIRADSTDTELKPAYISVVPHLVGDFYADTLYAVPGETIQFFDQTMGNPEIWIWDFGNNTNGFGQNPVTSFANPGSYSVRLVVSNQYLTDTVVKEDYIQIFEPVVANFTVSPFEGKIGDEIQFFDLSAGNPDTWEWWLGEGDTSHQQNPKKIYTDSGLYDITLIAGNEYLADTLSIADFLYIVPPDFSQLIQLDQGWSGVSTWVRPYFSDISNILAPVSGDLFFAFNSQGVYSPALNINTIGSWDINQGLVVYMNAPSELLMEGYENMGNTLNLPMGWSLMPVYSQCGHSAAKFEVLLGNDLELIKEIGGHKILWPAQGISTLDSIKPGKLYEILMNQPAELVFPSCD